MIQRLSPLRYQVLLAILMIALSGCAHNAQHKGAQSDAPADSLLHSLSYPTKIKYAVGLSIEVIAQDYKLVTITNPENSADTLAAYLLGIKKPSDKMMHTLPLLTQYVQLPLKRIVCLSTTQVGAFDLLGYADRIVGGIDVKKYFSPNVRKYVEEGKIVNVGSGMDANSEYIMAQHPDLITRTQHDLKSQRGGIVQSGIPMVIINEWQEKTLLGRAEWLKLYGELMGCASKADSIFNTIDSTYQSVAILPIPIGSKVTVLHGQEFQGAWYLPSDESYVADALITAGGEYNGPSDASIKRTPLSFEKVLHNYKDAQVWFMWGIPGVNTLDDLKKANGHYALFDAYKSGRVFMNNKRINIDGGNDYWESGIYRPDLLLKDYHKAMYPNSLPEYELTYWKQLER